MRVVGNSRIMMRVFHRLRLTSDVPRLEGNTVTVFTDARELKSRLCGDVTGLTEHG